MSDLEIDHHACIRYDLRLMQRRAYSWNNRWMISIFLHYTDFCLYLYIDCTLFIETIDTRNRLSFMIPSQKINFTRIPNLQRKQQTYTLYSLSPTINIITKKQIVGIGNITTNFKQLHQIIKLPMHISTDKYRCSHIYNIGFFCKYLSMIY